MQRLRQFIDESSASSLVIAAFLGTITVMSLLVALVGGGLLGWWILTAESAAAPATAVTSAAATRVPIGLPTMQAFVQQTMVAMDAANLIAMPATATPAPVQPTSTAVAVAVTSVPPPTPGDPTANILSLLLSDPQFSTLVQAVQSAGMADTLRTGGPFTLFAPTNAAFEQLPEGTLEALLQNPDALAELLSYHLVPQRLEQSAFATTPALRTVLGPALALRVTGTSATVNGAAVAASSPATGNGLVHPIDMVLQTPDIGTLVGTRRVDQLVARRGAVHCVCTGERRFSGAASRHNGLSAVGCQHDAHRAALPCGGRQTDAGGLDPATTFDAGRTTDKDYR